MSGFPAWVWWLLPVVYIICDFGEDTLIFTVLRWPSTIQEQALDALTYLRAIKIGTVTLSMTQVLLAETLSVRLKGIHCLPSKCRLIASLTRSQARSLLSIAKAKSARSRHVRESSNRTRMDQTCFGSRGFFWPMSNPLFQGRWHRPTGRSGIRDPPPSRPPRRSIASV